MDLLLQILIVVQQMKMVVALMLGGTWDAGDDSHGKTYTVTVV